MFTSKHFPASFFAPRYFPAGVGGVAPLAPSAGWHGWDPGPVWGGKG